MYFFKGLLIKHNLFRGYIPVGTPVQSEFLVRSICTSMKIGIETPPHRATKCKKKKEVKIERKENMQYIYKYQLKTTDTPSPILKRKLNPGT